LNAENIALKAMAVTKRKNKNFNFLKREFDIKKAPDRNLSGAFFYIIDVIIYLCPASR
jgi:hypothetical protein